MFKARQMRMLIPVWEFRVMSVKAVICPSGRKSQKTTHSSGLCLEAPALHSTAHRCPWRRGSGLGIDSLGTCTACCQLVWGSRKQDDAALFRNGSFALGRKGWQLLMAFSQDVPGSQAGEEETPTGTWHRVSVLCLHPASSFMCS